MGKSCLKKKDGLWVLFNGSEYVVGLTKEAQDDLGKITFASTPKKDQRFTQGEMLIELEAEKAVNEYNCPLTGVVSSVNEKIDENVDVLNDEDEMNVWIVSLKEVDHAQFEAL